MAPYHVLVIFRCRYRDYQETAGSDVLAFRPSQMHIGCLNLKSFIRWAGSKKQSLWKLREYWSDSCARYIEPFAGSASLFFDIEPRSALLGDINRHLTSTMRELQKDPTRVVECLRRLPRGAPHYYRIRSEPGGEFSPAERAARFIYLNRYCFNGLYRTNTQGNFNVPYGPPKSGREIDEEAIFSAARLLRNAEIVTSDFVMTLEEARRGDFVYMDPPYVVARRRIFSEYGVGSFSETDLERLGRALKQLDNVGAKFVVTYADSSEARRLFSGWRTTRFRAKRNISGFLSGRRSAFEIIATNMSL